MGILQLLTGGMKPKTWWVIRFLLAANLLVAGQPAVVLAEPRSPHVAGQFYPADPAQLRQLVEGFFQSQAGPLLPTKPRILISPHAGYPYSGIVAGSAFRQVKGQRYEGVVVVGFTHRQPLHGVSVDTRDSYQTPLGVIPVDEEAVRFLQQFSPTQGGQVKPPIIRHAEEAHEAPEHSLEVMLPFLQVALGELKLVPILLGQVSAEETAQLAEALAALSNRGDYLFVFSTDLSHYHPYDEAVAIDQRTVGAILLETPQAVERLFTYDQIEACGRGPILTALFLSAKMGYLKKELLRYQNSGDTAGDRSRVVGYAAIGMVDAPRSSQPLLSKEAGMALVRAARHALEQTLIHGENPPPLSLEQYPELAQASGIFVTLRRNGLLCGCIGRIQTDEPLAKTLPVVALDAALRDPRFPPVRGEELDEIHIEVSILSEPHSVADPQDIVAGRDGVVLEHEGHHGVFLPTVWDETGWTRVEFLRELASQKAGLHPDAWRQASLSVFQAQVFEESPVAVGSAH
jgi:AmmeMemoRadiSam system protein B/AmmeMemoRadiSam system protein A